MLMRGNNRKCDICQNQDKIRMFRDHNPEMELLLCSGCVEILTDCSNTLKMELALRGIIAEWSDEDEYEPHPVYAEPVCA
jgi:hypothetical protein